MISRTVTLPELGLIAGTRAALGLGIGLLIADRIAPDKRRAIGWTLLAVGVVTTVPLLASVLGRGSPTGSSARTGANNSRDPLSAEFVEAAPS